MPTQSAHKVFFLATARKYAPRYAPRLIHSTPGRNVSTIFFINLIMKLPVLRYTGFLIRARPDSETSSSTVATSTALPPRYTFFEDIFWFQVTLWSLGDILSGCVINHFNSLRFVNPCIDKCDFPAVTTDNVEVHAYLYLLDDPYGFQPVVANTSCAVFPLHPPPIRFSDDDSELSIPPFSVRPTNLFSRYAQTNSVRLM